MKPEQIQEHRRTRLKALLAQKYDDKKVELARALGQANGSFVRQMIDGERPITEKTVAKIERLHGCHGWFALGQSEHAVVTPMPPTPIVLDLEALAAWLASLAPEDRAEASGALADLARYPDSRLAIQRARNAVAHGLSSSLPTWRDAALLIVARSIDEGIKLDPAKIVDTVDKAYAGLLEDFRATMARRSEEPTS